MDHREQLAREALVRAGMSPEWWPHSQEDVIGMGLLIERVEALEAALIAAGLPLRYRVGGLTDIEEKESAAV